MRTKEELRRELSSLDRQFLELAARRLQAAREIGELKRRSDEPTRDFEREAAVHKQGRDIAASLNIEQSVADELLSVLIKASLTTQEIHRVRADALGLGQRVLVIGGSGGMGDWMARFLTAQGFEVEVADPKESPSRFHRWDRWEDSGLDHDIIVVATPLRVAVEILGKFVDLKPVGLIFDIGSLKLPLRDKLAQLIDAGCRVSSVHPMFGPSTQLLTERHVLFVDVGDSEATEKAKSLFASTMAELVDMSMEDHDRMIAHVLGLSHAINLVFLKTLVNCGVTTDILMNVSSTTFDNQFKVAALVAHENPHLYYEIQKLNEYGPDVLAALANAAQEIADIVSNDNEAEFVSIMRESRDFISRRVPD